MDIRRLILAARWVWAAAIIGETLYHYGWRTTIALVLVFAALYVGVVIHERATRGRRYKPVKRG